MRGYRIFFIGGGGLKTVWTTFFLFCFFRPQLILQFRGDRGKTIHGAKRYSAIFQTMMPYMTEGVQLFSRGGGGPTFSGGGVQMLISIEPHITCDFPGGGGVHTPYPPSGSAHELIAYADFGL